MREGLEELERELRDFAAKYLAVLHGTLSDINLVSSGLKSNKELFYFSQVLDSVYPLFRGKSESLNAIKSCGVVVDVGFGGGFPLLPLGLILPEEIKIIGIESISKKVVAVEKIMEELKFEREIKLINNRLENIEFDRDVVILFKAVGNVNDCLSKIRVSNGKRIFVFFYKGPNFYDKENLSVIKSNNANWDLLEEYKYTITTGKDGDLIERLFLGFERNNKRNKKCSKSGPIGPEFLKISQFL
ncbi:MAG: class I SAM-dependent methyltransferase [Oligoflexia bacterium]|nr:class I SAM-dependent methyltransferase [Oligoflexia bacterium]